MRATQKELAEVFDVTDRTIRRWDGEGLAAAIDKRSGQYDLGQAVAWYVEREAKRRAEALAAMAADGNGGEPLSRKEWDVRWRRARALHAEQKIADPAESISLEEFGALLEDMRDAVLMRLPRDRELRRAIAPLWSGACRAGREEAMAGGFLRALSCVVLDVIRHAAGDPALEPGWVDAHLGRSLAYGDAIGAKTMSEEEAYRDWHERRGLPVPSSNGSGT